jgi:hypothetical protein
MKFISLSFLIFFSIPIFSQNLIIIGKVVDENRETMPGVNIKVKGIDGGATTRKHIVCGNVVSTKKHKKGHVFINLDKKFPNQVFSISIFESNIKNFEYEPEIYLINKQVCFRGEIGEYSNTPNMVLEHSKQVKLLEKY